MDSFGAQHSTKHTYLAGSDANTPTHQSGPLQCQGNQEEDKGLPSLDTQTQQGEGHGCCQYAPPPSPESSGSDEIAEGGKTANFRSLYLKCQHYYAIPAGDTLL